MFKHFDSCNCQTCLSIANLACRRSISFCIIDRKDSPDCREKVDPFPFMFTSTNSRTKIYEKGEFYYLSSWSSNSISRSEIHDGTCELNQLPCPLDRIERFYSWVQVELAR